jgi:hypothetical protein
VRLEDGWVSVAVNITSGGCEEWMSCVRRCVRSEELSGDGMESLPKLVRYHMRR